MTTTIIRMGMDTVTHMIITMTIITSVIFCDLYEITMFFYDPINSQVIMKYISDFTKERSIYHPLTLEKPKIVLH